MVRQGSGGFLLIVRGSGGIRGFGLFSLVKGERGRIESL